MTSLGAAVAWLVRRDSTAMWSDAPPDPRTRLDNNPTLLYSWWCTCFSVVIILLRVCGRKVRSNVLFREDWIMLAAIIPLLLRMGCAHVILIYGTNNVQTVGVDYTDAQLDERSVGSRVVLVARIMYAAFIWTNKLSVSEFLKRITIRIWRRSYEITLQGIRIFLVVTFFAVVIATISECQPFTHYWQVVPDPGPSCRQGYAQLLTMGVCDIITDVLLIVFPIPIILNSGQNWKRKLQLAALFSLSSVMIAVTATRVPQVIMHLGRQQYRTVWASSEILASSFVSNAVILGSFVRDKGTKRNKYRQYSQEDSVDKGNSQRRATLHTIYTMDSDEDLFHSMGCRMPDHLQTAEDTTPRPSPPAPPAPSFPFASTKPAEYIEMEERQSRSSEQTEDSINSPPTIPANPLATPKASRADNSFDFFDVGGLLENGRDQRHSYQTQDGVTAVDFASPSPLENPSSRRPSHAFLQDIGVLPSPTISRSSYSSNQLPSSYFYQRRPSDASSTDPSHPPPSGINSRSSPYRINQPPIGVLGPMLERRETEQRLQDAGGLLTPIVSHSSNHTASTADTTSWQVATGIQNAPTPLQKQDTQQSLGLQDVGGLLRSNSSRDASRPQRSDVESSQSRRSEDTPRRSNEDFGRNPRSLRLPGRR